ncbi:phage head closure protein [Sediminibacillus massiliensis]|uniref:phage head closure protein n=1 Tax=Sediminibacillus massiliensis TaxID=1926277 RepID=UPI0015C40AB7|nr:phage head closure protein [Sediminibacillus massiliensis]
MRAIVERYTTVDDGMGGETHEWDTHLELEGTLDQLSADEVLANEKLGVVSSHIFIIFEIVDVKETDRMIIGDKIYQINNVDNPNNLNRQLEISLEYTGDTVG